MGIFFLLAMDRLVPHLHLGETKPEGRKSNLKKTTMLVLAVTLHNFPEGMAVGVVFAGMMADSAQITLAGAMALSVGIAIQNFPEGAIISLPLKSEQRVGKRKGFSLRDSFRGCRAIGSCAYHSFIQFYRASSSLSPGLRCGGYDLCSGGRADPGNQRRGTQQYRNDRICRRICSDDDPGCGPGISR